MSRVKLVSRIFIWSFLMICILSALLLYSLGDINKLKQTIEKNLKDQLSCTVKLGDLDWDLDGLKLGVTTSNISLYDNENNLVLQSGPTRFVWHIKHILARTYSHFYSIESINLYLHAIRYSNGVWNLIDIFPVGPLPKVDNLSLHNSIIYLTDELNQSLKSALYKDLNLTWQKKPFSNLRRIDLTTQIGTHTGPSSLKIKGKYSERKRFDWLKSELYLYVLAKQISLSYLQNYISVFIKESEIRKFDGEFTGFLQIKKRAGEKLIKVKSKTQTKNFVIGFKTKDAQETIDIPKTNFILKAIVDQKKIDIKSFKSNIDELAYELSGQFINWAGNLPETDLKLKTNEFNFKKVKPYLPLSLLPATTRARIEPINDEGFVELDLKLKGPLISPKYYGAIALTDFNLTAESGFLNVIQGLAGRLILDDEILKIEELKIPIEGSLLGLKGEVDSKNNKISFNLNGKNLAAHVLKDLLNQLSPNSTILNEINIYGKLDLNLDVVSTNNNPPDLKGRLNFHNLGVSIFEEQPITIKNVFGELLLDGSKVIFNKLNGLIDDEDFLINGDFSLKEDEKINLTTKAKHLNVIHQLLSFLARKSTLKAISESIYGEASDLDLNIGGTFTRPLLTGMVLISNVSFAIPNLDEKISDISGSIRFEGNELVVEEINGKLQNADFSIAGYIEDLFTKPKPKLRLITQDIELANFWRYIKEQLKTTSLNTQVQELEKLNGIAALDIFVHPDAILGNIYFKNGEIKYKPLPFNFENLSGRVVIGEKNISLFGFMGLLNGSNNFNSELTVFDYLNPSFYIQGQLQLDLDLPSIIKVANANSLNKIITNNLIPTQVNFDIQLPYIRAYLYSTLDNMLEFEIPPYIKKPPNKDYVLSGNIDFNTKDLDLYLSNLNIKANKLSLTANGSIKDITSQNPEIMLYFTSDESCGLFMVIQPIAPLMGFKAWGMIELNGSLSGTPSRYIVSSNAKITELELPELLGKKLKASNAELSLYLDTEQGTLSSKINNIDFVSLKAKSVTLSTFYLNPVFYLNELVLDGNPGSIYAKGSYDPRDNKVEFNADGTSLDLASLGTFIFLDPSKLAGTTSFSLMINGAGKTKDEILANGKGNLSFNINDGKLGQVVLLQKGIQLANIFSQGIFGFNLKNVLSLFFKYQDGSFNIIRGELELNKGLVETKEFNYRAQDLFLNSFGFLDLINSFVALTFYGYLPEQNSQNAEAGSGVISVISDTTEKKKFFVPFISSNPPKHFKFEVKGALKNSKRITRHARRSFKWLKGRQLKKDSNYLPAP